MKNQEDYFIKRLTFDQLNELAENFSENWSFDLDFCLPFYIIILASENGERHGKYYFSAKDIFEQEFGREVRGYSKVEVDEFLDDVIKDYETYAALVKSLRQEIADLKEELTRKPQVSSAPSPSHPDPIDVAASSSMTNFDILKRLNRLEKEVFGKQILDNTDL